MRDDEFQEELCPVPAVDLARPFGHWVSLETVEKSTSLERTIDDDGHAPVLRQWQ